MTEQRDRATVKLVMIKREAEVDYDYDSPAVVVTNEAETLEAAFEATLQDADYELVDRRGNEPRYAEADPELYVVADDLSAEFVARLHALWDERKAKHEAEEAAKKELERRASAMKRAEKLRAEIAAFAPSEQLAKMERELAEIEALLCEGGSK